MQLPWANSYGTMDKLSSIQMKNEFSEQCCKNDYDDNHKNDKNDPMNTHDG